MRAPPVPVFTARIIVDRHLRFPQVLVHDDAIVRGSGLSRAASKSAT